MNTSIVCKTLASVVFQTPKLLSFCDTDVTSYHTSAPPSDHPARLQVDESACGSHRDRRLYADVSRQIVLASAPPPLLVWEARPRQQTVPAHHRAAVLAPQSLLRGMHRPAQIPAIDDGHNDASAHV